MDFHCSCLFHVTRGYTGIIQEFACGSRGHRRAHTRHTTYAVVCFSNYPGAATSNSPPSPRFHKIALHPKPLGVLICLSQSVAVTDCIWCSCSALCPLGETGEKLTGMYNSENVFNRLNPPPPFESTQEIPSRPTGGSTKI